MPAPSRSMTNRLALLLILMASLGVGLSAARPATPTHFDVVHFVENQGQWRDAGIRYGCRARGLQIAMRDSSFTIADAITVAFPGSHDVMPIGSQPQAAKFNFFVGGRGRGAASNVPSFGEVIYENLYDGVDLHVRGGAGAAASPPNVLKYEFHVAPGADHTQIRVSCTGGAPLCLTDAGSVQIESPLGALLDTQPLVWQELHGQRRAIEARFELLDDHTYRVALEGPIDPSAGLIIDPELQWMAYEGGSSRDWPEAIAVDDNGNAYIAGSTQSSDFAGRINSYGGGYDDAFVVKVSPEGETLWMTYLGGSTDDDGAGIAITPSGDVIVTGQTHSYDFSGRLNAHHGGYSDAFALKLTPAGTLEWMTYLGGNDSDGGDGIVADEAGDIFVCGRTQSTDFAGRNNAPYGNEDAFLVSITAAGAMQWMVYLGGSYGDSAYGIAVDGDGNLHLVGSTGSDDFVGRINAYHGGGDAYTLVISPQGVLQWMAFVGGSGADVARDIAIDEDGSMLLTGDTASTDFEGRTNSSHGASDAFIVRVSSSGEPLWATFLGGSDSDLGYGVGIDAAGDGLVVGYTKSADYVGRINARHGEFTDAFALRVTPAGQVRRMMYLGGSDSDVGRAAAVGPSGSLLVTGTTGSPDFFGRINSYFGGTSDCFLVKVHLADGPRLTVNATCPSGGPVEIQWAGATPNGRASLLFALNTANSRIPDGSPCAGTYLGLGPRRLHVAFAGDSDPDGSRTLNANAGPNACGGYLQLLDVPTCGTSNVAVVE